MSANASRLSSSFALVFVYFAISHAHALAPAVTSRAQVDWSQPPVMCVEEALPSPPDRPCLNLSHVTDPLKDWPQLPPAELKYWQANKRPLDYCRALEVLRREEQNPGSQSAGRIEMAWMQKVAVAHRDQKVAAVYRASRAHRVPAQILTGALYQESMFSELGIAEDGGNYSCGVGQINLTEWCHWANAQNASEQTRLGWTARTDCSLLDPAVLKPFYDIAVTRLNGLPEYRLDKTHFQNIGFPDVASGLPSGSAATQQLRFAAAQSFIDNCSDAANGIAAKAHELSLLYRDFVPRGLKERDQYENGASYQRRCLQADTTGLFPLHMGWLLAVGTYNAGPRAVDSMAYYNGWTPSDLASSTTFDGFTIPDLVETLYWSGRYSAADDKIHFTRLDGSPSSWIWFKPCVLQRHIARVVQNVTLPDAPALASSLEGAYRCAKSVFDPHSGALITSAVPPERQQSPGIRRGSTH